MAKLIQVNEIIAVCPEAGLAIVPALYHMESHARDSESGRSSHSRTTILQDARLTSYDPDPELALTKSSTARLNASGCSQKAEWPHSGTTSVLQRFTCEAIIRMTAGGE